MKLIHSYSFPILTRCVSQEKEERIVGEEKGMVKKASASSNSRKMVRSQVPSAECRDRRLSLSLIIPTPGQEYAQVVKMLGNGRCECFCFDGVTRLGHIRGKMRKKVWITAGDIVLVAKRDFQDEKVDIVHKYTADEARNLKQYGELPETARINETAVDMAMAGGDDDDDIGIDFDDI
jgi:translation initiation factor 1A